MQSAMMQILYKGIFRWFLKLIVGVQFPDTRFLRKEGQFIILANHNSHLDTLSLLSSLPGNLLWKIKPVAAEDYFGRTRFQAAFSNYFSNTLLIAMQKPEATYVAGYTSWQRNFDRQVMKGEKGIKILAPAPYKAKEEREKIDPSTQKPVLDADGNVDKDASRRVEVKFRLKDEEMIDELNQLLSGTDSQSDTVDQTDAENTENN